MTRHLNALVALAFATLVMASLPAVSAAADPPTYNDQIAPLLKKYCTGCHNAEDREGELVLARYDQILSGGEHGAVIAAGDSARSRLIQVLIGKAKPAMPPEDNERPTPDEIALLAAWIDAGAKGPDGAEPDPTVLVTPAIAVRGTAVEPISAAASRPTDGAIALARYGRIELGAADGQTARRKLDGLRGRANAVGFSRDGALVWAAGGEPGLFGELKVWNVDSGSVVQTLRGHQDSLYAAALSPDGKLLATGSYDQQIKIWDAASGQELRTLTGHNDAVFDLAFRSDSRVLASASGDRTVKLWDVATGERLDTLGQSLKDLYSVAFSPDGRFVVAGGVDNRIRMWQISADAKENTNPLIYSRFAHEGAIIKLAYSPDGRTLVSAGEDRSVKVWDAEKLVERYAIEGQSDWATAIAISPDNQTLLVGRLDGTTSAYNLATGDLANGNLQTPKTSAALPRRSMHGVALANENPATSIGRTAGRLGGRLALLAADRMLPISIISSASSLLMPAALGQAQAPPPAKPELTGLSVRGLKRGVATHLTLSGKALADASAIKTNSDLLPAKIVAAAPESLDVEFSPAAELARGRYEVWAVTPAGESAHLAVFVDDLDQASEQEPNDPPGTAGPLKSPIAIWGTLTAQGDSDRYAFDAQAGSTLVFEVAAAEIGSKANAVLTLTDAQGHVLATNNDFDGSLDPLLAYTFSVDGHYAVEVADLLGAGSADHFYRLSMGPFRFVTSVFPLSIAAGQEREVELVGLNLPERAVKLPAAAAGELEVPLDAGLYRFRKLPKLIVGTLPETVESEPNDQPQQATPIAAPGVVGGRIAAGLADGTQDVDLYRFESQAGQSWIIETEAARRGSPIDTVIEVLSADGQPVPRLLLAATRDSYITFRAIDAVQRECRVVSWEEMQLNELLYLGGEVVKLYRAPQGPDSGFQFYEGDGGKRKNYFDTTATTHALDEPCYIVEPHPLGTRLVPNGLPIFTLNYANDDDAQRRLGSDSRLTFTAPAGGSYLVRVRDARGAGGPRSVYRLIVREPRPDFGVTLGGAGMTVDAGSGKGFSLSVDRIDGFDGEVKVDISGLPAGFHVDSPVVIQAGQRDARGVIWVDADAVAPAAGSAAACTVHATALVDGKPVVKPVNNFGELKLGAKPKLIVRLEPAELTVVPGASVTALIKVERNGHDELITFNVDNLPHGVIVDNIGLSGVMMPKGQTERQIFLNAAPWVSDTDRTCFAVENQAGNQASMPLLLKVRKGQ